MNETPIEWTDFTSNPIKYRRKSDGTIVWACVKCSPGCAHCYAEKLALRWHRGKLFTAGNMEEVEPFLDLDELRSWVESKKLKAGSKKNPGGPAMVFVGDMTDVFGPWVADEDIAAMLRAAAACPWAVFQFLTKRAERLESLPAGMVPENAWLGVSVEDQERLRERGEKLLRAPGKIKFLSCEPLLEAIDLHDIINYPEMRRAAGSLINQVIVGGESGPGKRPIDLDAARFIRDQCALSKVAYFFKQVDKVQAIPDDLMIRQWPDFKMVTTA